MSRADCAAALADAGLSLPPRGNLLHVGGNQWYKNRAGVLEAYEVYAGKTAPPLPLWMVGAPPDEHLRAAAQRLDPRGTVLFLSGLTDNQLCAAYSSARLLLFPSLAEGFGWPVAEAMACGCLVLTTDQAPMSEVGGEAAYYLPRRPDLDSGGWARTAADRIMQILTLPTEERSERRRMGLAQAAKFDAEHALDEYERIYLRVLKGSLG